MSRKALSPPPSLTEALADALDSGLERAADLWIRAEIPVDWPIREALISVATRRSCDINVAALSPFKPAGLRAPRLNVESLAWKITNAWRNDASRSTPTVVLGAAAGLEEDGLKKTHLLITEGTVFAGWQSALARWCTTNVHSDTVSPVVQAVVHRGATGEVNPDWLDEYLKAALENGKGTLGTLKSQLWRLGLCPDPRLLDVGSASSRIETNLSVRRLLVSSADSVADQRKLERLQDAASDKAGERKTVASSALEYRKTRNREALKTCNLEVMLQILSPRSTALRPKKPRTLDVFDLLDVLADCPAETRSEVLADLGDQWDLESDEPLDLSAGFIDANGHEYEAAVHVIPSISLWAATDEEPDQVVAFRCSPSARQDWLPWPPEGAPITEKQFRALGEQQDAIAHGNTFSDLLGEYFTRRAAMRPFERWLRTSGPALLLLRTDAREAVREFKRAWLALVDAAVLAAKDDQQGMRDALVLLEAMWSKGEPGDERWCVLGPLHQYTLDPLLQAVDLAATRLGEPGLGSEVAWVLDRSLPAYRVLWTKKEPLLLARTDGVAVYSSSHHQQQPAVRSGTGLLDICKAFLDYHPFARRSFTLTLIDPPKGGAIAKNLHRLEQEVDQLLVNVVLTRPDSAQPESMGDSVRFVGRFGSVAKWSAECAVNSHVAVMFTPRQPGTTEGASHWGPTPGAHVALRVGVRAPDFLDAQVMAPYVTFEPREQNRVVVGMQKLAAVNDGGPRLFEVEPMLKPDQVSDFESVGVLADWVVLGAPSPLGLVPAKELSDSFTYIGRGTLGLYGLFVYATTMFPIRRLVNDRLKTVPASPADADALEARLVALAQESATGVLRMGQPGVTLWEQIGILVAGDIAKNLDV